MPIGAASICGTADVTFDRIVTLLSAPENARDECSDWIEVVHGIETPGVGIPLPQPAHLRMSASNVPDARQK